MFAVVWSHEAFEQMNGIVTRHPARKAELAGALRTLAQLLSVSPAEAGESREDDFRILFVGPLVVDYRVDSEQQIAEVVSIALRR
jgi:hypothetical protein